MKILRTNQFINEKFSFKNRAKRSRSVNEMHQPLNSELIDTVIAFAEEGECDTDETSNVKAPFTHETIYQFFPQLTKRQVEQIDSEMKRRGSKWRYPHNADAVKSGNWTYDELGMEDAGVDNFTDFDDDAIKTIAELAQYGDFGVDGTYNGSKDKFPFTQESIYLFFPSITQDVIDNVNAYMKKNGMTWKYPTYEDAVKQGNYSWNYINQYIN